MNAIDRVEHPLVHIDIAHVKVKHAQLLRSELALELGHVIHLKEPFVVHKELKNLVDCLCLVYVFQEPRIIFFKLSAA